MSRETDEAAGTTGQKHGADRASAADIAALLHDLMSSDGQVHGRAASELIRLGQQVADPLFELLSHRTLPLSNELASLLGALEDPRGVDYLIPAVESGAASASVLWALEAIGDKRAVNAILACLGTCEVAAPILRRIGAPVREGVLQAYTTDPVVRRRCGELVGALGGDAALGLLIEAFCDPLRAVRTSAADGLVTMGALAVEPLLQILPDGMPEARARIADLLGRIEDHRALPALLNMARGGQPIERRAAVQALARLPSAETFEALAGAMRDRDCQVRRLAAVAPQASPIVELLRLSSSA
jgi:HEAT repeat protein